jgi:nitrite reductase/ring-hydroxylating ferredoxin subunit
LFRLASPNIKAEEGPVPPGLTDEAKQSQQTIQNGTELQIYAMEAQCPHLGADLSHAEIEEYEDDLVAVCPWHR